MVAKFSNEPGLIYSELVTFPDDSIYRGSLVQVPAGTITNSRKLSAIRTSSTVASHVSQNTKSRVSIIGQFLDRSQATSQSLDNEEEMPATGDGVVKELRHGFGVQYYADGSHYEG